MPSMSWFLKKYKFFLVGIFFLVIFFIAKSPVDNPDTFYHVKTGEIFFHYGILHKDIYSFTAQNRTWFPYEWLFEVIAYIFTALFGYMSLSYFTAGVVVIQIGILFFFLKKYFNLPMLLSIVLSFIYFTWSYETFVARPQIFALLFFTITFFSIFLYIKTRYNYLWVALIAILLWTNLHPSVIFGLYLFFSYACICFFLFLRTKENLWLAKARVLSFYLFIATILTILPPLGILQYRLLFLVTQHLSEIRTLIIEWEPLSKYDLFFQALYVIPAILGVAFFLSIHLKKNAYAAILLITPLLIFLVLPYISYRNIIFAYIVLIFVWGWNLSYLHFPSSMWKKVIFISIIATISLFYIYNLFSEKSFDGKIYNYPDQAANFLLTHHINGNMFNTFAQGSYLIYRLYPHYKVFIDLRADVYLCCEIPRYQKIINGGNLSDMAFYALFQKEILTPYKISFVILSMKNDLLSQKIAHVLTNNFQWEPVFWDDRGMIFVKKDNKNNSILKQFGALSATPYENTLYRTNKLQQAFLEYSRMENIADSAKTRNALGFIYTKEKQYTKARQEFEKAIFLDPTFDSPYANLAELNLINGSGYANAIQLYQKALQLNPERPYLYIRLGELYIKGQNDTSDAISIWTKGLETFRDNNVQNSFKKLIQETQSAQ